ncbi:MAG: glutathione S-transferase family protein [Acetobacteraceae bacterium]
MRGFGQHRYILGDTYTVVDMAAWAWARLVPFVIGPDAFDKMANLKRLVDEVTARPGGAAGARAEGEAQLQGGDGRRGAQVHVPAERVPRRLNTHVYPPKRAAPRGVFRGAGSCFRKKDRSDDSRPRR